MPDVLCRVPDFEELAQPFVRSLVKYHRRTKKEEQEQLVGVEEKKHVVPVLGLSPVAAAMQNRRR